MFQRQIKASAGFLALHTCVSEQTCLLAGVFLLLGFLARYLNRRISFELIFQRFLIDTASLLIVRQYSSFFPQP